jgi:hypothetical protein
LIIRPFKSQIFLDTSVLSLIRFPQNVLMDFNLRWNYSPLKKRPPKLPGGLFVGGQFSVPSSQFSVLSVEPSREKCGFENDHSWVLTENWELRTEAART